jgi:molecular chaperone HscB
MTGNYFDLFEMPVKLVVDKREAHRRFIELSRKYHPDYFAQENEEMQAEMLEVSADLTKGLKIFQKPDETIKYVLQLKGLLEEEEKYALPPAFLMEMMEVNEALMEVDDEAGKAGIEKQIDNLQNDIYEPVKGIVEGYQEGDTTEEELLQVKAYYYKKKYLDRIRQQLAGSA